MDSLGEEGGQKALPTSFSPVTSTNVEIIQQNFVTFSFNRSATLAQNLKTLVEILHQCDRRVETKSYNVLLANSYV